MNITKANGKNEYELIKNLKKRSGQTDEKIVEAVTTIINSVKEQGDEAVREFTVRFDGMVPKKTVIEKDELNFYLDEVDEDFKNAIIKAIIFTIFICARLSNLGSPLRKTALLWGKEYVDFTE